MFFDFPNIIKINLTLFIQQRPQYKGLLLYFEAHLINCPMSLLSAIIQQSARLSARRAERAVFLPVVQQHRQLAALLHQARATAFGRYYGFREILRSEDVLRAFQRQVPATDYHGLYDRWWSQAHLSDTPDVCWPGTVPYFALSSGTSQASTKYVPVTDDMLHVMKRGARQLFGDMSRLALPARHLTRKMLMVGSCTQLRQERQHWTGDLSGIIGLNRPRWMEYYYCPGRKISHLPEWNQRIECIAEAAPGWDIGSAVSNPMWMQLILERIIERHRLRHIHELWPNFSVLVHGGVFFEPYRPTFERLLGRPVAYMDSYMASEGFFAYQQGLANPAMRLLTGGGIFFEFVPFTAKNFDDNGDLRSACPESIPLDQVQEGVDYALLISTCAGAWRYLLGDTVQFTDVERANIRLTGRTKQFLSVCGEHLSIDNLNEAVRQADRQLGAGVREFTVAGRREGARWTHEWYVACENPSVSESAFAQAVDAALCRLNDDYAIERVYALQAVRVRFLPNSAFLNWLAQRGKLNGQAKVPRVLKGELLTNFTAFLRQQNLD